MRVACPDCSAAYELPPALAARLGEGRPLRCARCGHTWKPDPSAEAPAPGEAAPAPPAPGAAAPEEPRRPEAPPPAAPAMPGPVTPAGLLAAAWAASLLLLAGMAAAAWTWRIDLVEAWPPAARAFMALGLAG